MSMRPVEDLSTICFSVLAAAEPGVMPRVLETLAKRNLVPTQWYSVVGGADGTELAIDFQMRGMDRPQAEQIARCLRQIADVTWVATSEKALAGRAA